MKILNPFFIRLNLTLKTTPSEFVDRLNSRVKPLDLKDGFEKSLHPRGTVIGFCTETHFELHEAMYGYGGASVKGTLSTTAEGTFIQGVVRPSLYMTIGFIAIFSIYALICLMYGGTILRDGLSLGRLVAFTSYTLVFLGMWQFTARDMRGLATFLADLSDN